MKYLIKKLKQYLPFSKAGVKSVLVYKSQTFMWLLISFIDVFFIIFLYNAIYRNSADGLNSVINGFTYYEMILYMITSFIFSFVITGTETNWNIFTDIKEGTIANTLTKPVSYRLRHLFTYFGSLVLKFLVVVVPLLIISYSIFFALGLISMPILEILIRALLFMGFTVLGAILIDATSYFVGLMTFYTEHMFGLNMFVEVLQRFLSGAMVPLSFMGFFGVICSYSPFAFLNSTPVLMLMGKIKLSQSLLYFGVAIIWIVVFETINHFIFKHCIKKLTVQGG